MMAGFVVARLDFRATVFKVMLGALTLSLICSMSIKYGHADVPIASTAEDIKPLVAGDSAPSFVVKTVENENFRFDPRGLERPTIVIAFRGGWCPHCNFHLSELRTVLPEIKAKGIDVLFLSGDRPDLLYDSLRNHTKKDIEGLNYTILSDANATAAIAFGIAFRASERTINRRNQKGDDIEGSSMLRHGVLPVPSVYAIDTDGVISFAYVNADYKVRLPADELLQVATHMTRR